MDWLVPTNVSKGCSFMELVGYYCHFVKDFSQVAHSITSFQQKGKKYVWSNQCEVAFNALKECLTNAPVLTVPNSIGNFLIFVDDLLEGVGVVLMQDGLVITYKSRKLIMIWNFWLWCMLLFIGGIFFYEIGLSYIAIIGACNIFVLNQT